MDHAKLLRRCALAMATMLCLHAQQAPAADGTARQALAQQSCDGLRRAVAFSSRGDASTPLFLPSYRTDAQLAGVPDLAPSLANVAFAYDNALAGIALIACGDTASARRIADAMVLAVEHDPHYADGRIRNAYRAGLLADTKPVLAGYWDADKNQWIADAYQVSTATGNMAWAALLLLNVDQSAPSPRYAAATARLLDWIEKRTRSSVAPDGYSGGWYGWDDKQAAQTWKSTEHNIDIAMAAAWVARSGAHPEQKRQAATALAFVARMWNTSEQRFHIGTQADGATVSTTASGLDAQLWPLLAAPPGHCAWQAGLAWVDANHRFGAGYGFSRQPDGIWTEGSAQAAATLLAVKGSAPDALWQLLASQRAPNGLYYATPSPRISTGLAIGPDSKGPDFFYYRWPHLGATAWIALAAKGWNPFTGTTTVAGAKPCSN
ncbi:MULTISPECIES: hypothetical protein [Variovorax]|jgi:hypothetical protein|uniref:hypothetical protein n=2 Tax=Comamonadaceae TaxID=80864 RepID=UPI00086B985E|nr:hypothetical protein [Variovorax paradoxus]ODU17652.1 MAG: hypothetical protein ABS94_06970 [Variovorax sp. SCN 67-85]ODV27010.1 MAG: hypothetical protein ABT25_02325 [Variovorax sp. SCN 67-20]OJZ09335.1 MAG: hypothetical protein BGP22_36140 [Variovorax sp. 67-131]UKI04916.1 hypothetical protein L3V85_18875 [Variovorax paradoxus]